MQWFLTIRPAFLAAWFCVALLGNAWAQARTLSVDDVVSRMEQVQAESRTHSIAYTVTRQYELSAANADKPKSEVLAEVNFVPPSQKEYTVRKVEGADRGSDIVRKVLEHESQMAAHAELHEVSSRNYDFALVGTESLDGRDCYVLQLTPKRSAPELLRGQAWVDASNFQVRRLQGTPAKSPSWWIKNLQVTLNYAEVQGIWTQVATRAVADVRLLGKQVLTSRQIDLRTATVDARNRAPRRAAGQPNNSRRSVVDSAVWVSR